MTGKPPARPATLTEIPLARPQVGDEEVQAVAAVIRSGWVGQGPRVAEFERQFAQYLGVPHAIAVTSATTALHLCLLAAGVGPGDEVICPSFSFIASANCIRHVGARPVFVDIDPNTYNLDPALIEPALTPATRVILTVHQVGLPADLDSIREIAHARGLAVIEDAACAIGSRYRGRPVGADAALAVFSFHPRKIITTGEGGMVTTQDAATAGLLRRLRSHGASVSDLDRHGARGVVFEEYAELGYNYRMTDLQAALGVVQMERLPAILARYAEIAQAYDEGLAGMDELEGPAVPPYALHTFQSYLIRLTRHCSVSRDEVLRRMADRGVSCRRGIAPIHREPLYRALSEHVHLPVTEEAARSTLFLPIFAGMTDAQVAFVIGALRAAVARE